jgi:hypothetical protein
MLKKANRSTAVLVKEKLVDTKIVPLPIDTATINVVFDWFDEEEISLANAKADGEAIDEKYLEYICIAVNDLLETDVEKVDIEYLNQLIAAL